MNLRRLFLETIGSFLVSHAMAGTAPQEFHTDDLVFEAGVSMEVCVDSSERDVRDLIGEKGGPRTWRFDFLSTASEEKHRLEILPIGSVPHRDRFPSGRWVEQRVEEDGTESWSYYSLGPEGRWYHGFYSEVATDEAFSAQPLKVFDDPTLDLPARIEYGQRWERTVYFTDIIDAGLFQSEIAIEFVVEAEVDAYGELVLPNVGVFPALRVNELHTTYASDVLFGIKFPANYTRNYYWLVEGIGKAVDILSTVSTVPVPDRFIASSSIQRVVSASFLDGVGSEWLPIENIQIAIKGKEAFLSWPASAGGRYKIEIADGLGQGQGWTEWVETGESFLFDPISSHGKSRFYRLFYQTD